MGVGIGFSDSATVATWENPEEHGISARAARALQIDSEVDPTRHHFDLTTTEMIALLLVANVVVGFVLTSISVCICSARQSRVSPSERPLTPNKTCVWFLAAFVFGIAGWLPMCIHVHLSIHHARLDSTRPSQIKPNFLPSFKLYDSDGGSPPGSPKSANSGFGFPSESEQDRARDRPTKVARSRRQTSPAITMTPVLSLADELEAASNMPCNSSSTGSNGSNPCKGLVTF